jgi:hypothetical protein
VEIERLEPLPEDWRRALCVVAHPTTWSSAQPPRHADGLLRAVHDARDRHT